MNKLLAAIRNPLLPESIGGSTNPSEGAGGAAVGQIVSNMAGGIFIFAFITAFIYLLVGGFHWISSSGDKAKLESARNRILHAIIGIVVVASAWAMFKLVGQLLGLDQSAGTGVFTMPIPVFQ